VLEINERPRRDLRALIELVGQSRVERELDVHRTTVSRWLQGSVAIPAAQHLAIKALLGDAPGTMGKWTGWRFHDGKLVAPGGDAFHPGDILSLILLRQQLTAQRRELDALRLRVRVLETLTQKSANDARAVG
jgi:hypothetical protein